MQIEIDPKLHEDLRACKTMLGIDTMAEVVIHLVKLQIIDMKNELSKDPNDETRKTPRYARRKMG